MPSLSPHRATVPRLPFLLLLSDDEACSCDNNINGCCCGTLNGKTRVMYRCGRAMRFPFACVVGPHWGCSPCTMACMIVPTALFSIFISPEIHIAVFIVGLALLCVALSAYTTTAFSDPGYVTKRTPPTDDESKAALQAEKLERQDDDTVTFCEHCLVYRPQGTSHCFDCGVCVKELDHHCPWTGKCIGKHNLAPFYVWLTFMQILCLYVYGIGIGYVAGRALLVVCLGVCGGDGSVSWQVLDQDLAH